MAGQLVKWLDNWMKWRDNWWIKLQDNWRTKWLDNWFTGSTGWVTDSLGQLANSFS